MGDVLAKMARSGKKVYPLTESIPEKRLLEPVEFEGHYDPHGKLIIPGMTAAQLSSRLPTRHWLVAAHSALRGLLGLHLSVWLNCSMAGAMVVAGAGLFVLAWLFSPNDGLIYRWLRHPVGTPDATAWPEKNAEQPSP